MESTLSLLVQEVPKACDTLGRLLQRTLQHPLAGKEADRLFGSGQCGIEQFAAGSKTRSIRARFGKAD